MAGKLKYSPICGWWRHCQFFPLDSPIFTVSRVFFQFLNDIYWIELKGNRNAKNGHPRISTRSTLEGEVDLQYSIVTKTEVTGKNLRQDEERVEPR